MSGSLIIPYVEVIWGETNLTHYQLPGATQPAPIVFNVAAQLQDGNQNPTGSMEWEPTGPAFAVYENLLNTSLDQQIVVRYFYPGGRSIPLVFVWAGQTITYGVTTKIVIDLKSELDGLVNAAPRSVSSASKDEKASTKFGEVGNLPKQFNVPENLVKYSKVAEKDMKEAKIKSINITNKTYAETVNSLTQSNGNTLFPNNIEYAHMVVLTPWSYKGEAKTKVEDPGNSKVDPTVRYGFLLGPSTISTIERRYVWSPPQQTNNNQVAKAQPTGKGDKGKGVKPVTTVKTNADGSVVRTTTIKESNGSATRITETITKRSDGTPVTVLKKDIIPANTARTNSSSSGGKSPPGVSQGTLQPGIKNEEDKVGTEKQKLNNEENTAKISVASFMVPALTGVKPGDILYVPSLGTAPDLFMEDWVVRSVSYNQTDGGVSLSIEGSRWFGNSSLMQKEAAKPWVAKARELNSDPTLTKWQQYAWSLTGTTLPATTAAPVPLLVIPYSPPPVEPRKTRAAALE
jgi:hypothetical protein